MKLFCSFLVLIFTIINIYSVDRVFSKLGKYENVTITGVDRKGVRIIHSNGSTHITEEELNDSEKIKIRKELEEVKNLNQKYLEQRKEYLERKKKQKIEHERQITAQTEELAALIQKINQMSAEEALNMLGKKFSVDPHRKEFPDIMQQNYKLATNVNEIPALINKLENSYVKKLQEQAAREREKYAKERGEKAVIALDQLLNNFENFYRQYLECEYTKDFYNVLTNLQVTAEQIKESHPNLTFAEKKFLSEIILAHVYMKYGFERLQLSRKNSDLWLLDDAKRLLNDAKDNEKIATQHFKGAKKWLDNVRNERSGG